MIRNSTLFFDHFFWETLVILHFFFLLNDCIDIEIWGTGWFLVSFLASVVSAVWIGVAFSFLKVYTVPRWKVRSRPWKVSCKQAGLWKINSWNRIKWVFVCFLFQILHLTWKLSFILKSSKWFLNWHAEENIIVLRTSNFRGAASADSSWTETLYCL